MRLTATAWRITQDEYDKKARELKERQTEIALRIEQHQKGEEHFRMTLESLIYLASRAAELFERSKTEQKQQQIEKIGAGRHSTLLRNEARGLTGRGPGGGEHEPAGGRSNETEASRPYKQSQWVMDGFWDCGPVLVPVTSPGDACAQSPEPARGPLSGLPRFCQWRTNVSLVFSIRRMLPESSAAARPTRRGSPGACG